MTRSTGINGSSRARAANLEKYRPGNNKPNAQGFPSVLGKSTVVRNLILRKVNPNKATQKRAKPKSIATFTLTVAEYTYSGGGGWGETYIGVDTANIFTLDEDTFGSVQPPTYRNISTSIALYIGPTVVEEEEEEGDQTKNIAAIFVTGVAVGLSPGSPVNVRITNVTKSESQTFIMTAKATPLGQQQEAVDRPFHNSQLGGKAPQPTWSGSLWAIGDIIKLEILL